MLSFRDLNQSSALLHSYIYSRLIVVFLQLIIIEIIIQKERERSKLCPAKLASNLYGHQYALNMKSYLQAAPTLNHTPNLFNKSRLQLIKDAYRYMALTYNYNHNHKNKDTHPHFSTIYEILVSPSAVPAFAHCVMFIKYIQLMCNDKQKQLYLQKAIKYQIVGCYAQTQLGHGSDIKGLQTTAEYDVITKQWIIDSPTVSSAKYWPGELQFLANYAIVFAQTLIKGKNYGVHPFLVKIRDENYNYLPGIEGGDVGPKLGFHAKQNGYMYFRSIRIPRQNLFTKYVQVSQSGQYKTIGDSRIGYATMLSVRQLISCATTMGYPVVITIGARYAFFRRQFVNQNKEQIPIIEYQTQQDKIISRIAEYYAIRIAGNKISQIGQDNAVKVRNNDFSLLQETHSNLAFSKSLFSQLISEGGEIIRRSLGGHGTSYYSGVPQIMNELAANNTIQVQNTVMYIQTALYVLKNYSNYMRNAKSLQHSVEYINLFGQLQDTRFYGKQEWKTVELRDALIKTINYLVGLIVSRMMNKQEGEDQKTIINKVVGLRLQQLAQTHGVLFMVNQMLNTINQEAQSDIKEVFDYLCQLFAINQMQRLAQPIIEAAFICPLRWTQLSLQKQALLKLLRPHVAILLDSFLIPQKFIKSQLSYGNPYQNYLNRARECEINVCVSQAAKEVGKIKNILSAKPRM